MFHIGKLDMVDHGNATIEVTFASRTLVHANLTWDILRTSWVQKCKESLFDLTGLCMSWVIARCLKAVDGGAG
jgi:hypothetical protein